MSVVAGVDFGTLSVRISIFDKERGKLGSATEEYPLHRSTADPDFATQSHNDQMAALVKAWAPASEFAIEIRPKGLRARSHGRSPLSRIALSHSVLYSYA